MKAKEARALSQKHCKPPKPGKDYVQAIKDIKAACRAGERRCTIMRLTPLSTETITQLRRDGYTVQQGHGSDPRDKLCWTFSW